MSRREHRRFTAEQKLEILREAEQPSVTVSEVYRRHSLSPSALYHGLPDFEPCGPVIALETLDGLKW
jgi:transposase-like protein